MKKVLTRLEYERKFRLRMSQVELAALAGVSQSDVSLAEKGVITAPRVWKRLSDVLRMSPEELAEPIGVDIEVSQ